ncbi:hypothetical protein Pcinc_000625 [Petrolisthes cinctipes]|uniref:BED-type domain-containing protein n=1 Tax=Petrolisthes cinctipes TaxID=88211 RepID=A0AAE1L593_PETCI|nr:hypothetical protein Pcinc_000625 [Petrolisthes cinctipes]
MSDGANGKRSSSVIWEYYQNDPEVPTKAKCMKCGDKLQHSRNTSNLFKHLSKQYPLEYESALKNREATVKTGDTQPTIHQAFHNRESYARDSRMAKLLDKCLVNMLVADMQPASIVEDEGFKKCVHALDELYELPSRRKIMREVLPKEYEETKSKLSKILDKTKFIDLSSDIWTSCQTQAYICITGHFITSTWELKYIEQHDVITAVLCLLGCNEMCLPSFDPETMKEAVKILALFEEITREISADKHLSISKVIPITRLLQVTTLNSAQDSQSAIEHELQTSIQMEMSKRFSNIEANHRLAAATFLDPRFKRVTFTKPAMADQVQKRLTTEMCSIKAEETENGSDPDDPGPSSSESTCTATSEKQSNTRMWEWFEKKAKASEVHRTSSVEAALEIRHYMKKNSWKDLKIPCHFGKTMKSNTLV